MPGQPDWRPRARVKNPALFKQLHLRWRECALCETTQRKLSLHHIHKHPRDDLEANLIMLCGDGVTGCHGAIELGHAGIRRALGEHVLSERPDTVAYLREKLGEDQAAEWLSVRLLAG